MNNMNNNFCFFTIGKAQQSTEANEGFKKYIGVAPVKVLAVNPTKAEIKQYQGFEPTEEPVYHGAQEVDGKTVPYARVTFLVRTSSEKTDGIELTQQLSFFVRNQYRKGSNSGKYQVIDHYGNTAWGDEATIKANGTIMYSNGPAKILGSYRPAFVGEAALVNFIKEYLVIGSAGETNGFDYMNGSWVPKTGDALKDCEVYFDADEIKKMFNGDFSAVKEAISLMPNNEVKAVFGIRVDSNSGTERQDVYTRVLRNNSNRIDAIAKEIQDSKNNGGLSNRVYEFTPLHEYKVESTDFSNAPAAENPFETPTDNPWG